MAYIGKSPTGSGVRHRYVYTATGGETSLSGADDNSKTLKFTDGEYVDVHLNGVLLVQGTDYGVGTANTISSLAALAANDVVEITVYDVYNVAKINSEAMRNRWYFTATGGETSITTSEVAGLSFNANAEIEVRLNGVSLQQGVDFNTTTANQVGGLAALTAGQVVEIIHYADFQLADTVSKAAGGTFTGDVTIDNNLNVGTIKNEAGTQTAIEIDSNGVITQPVLPAFFARSDATLYRTVAEIVQYDDVTSTGCFNQGSHFDTSTYKFTAPVAGVYSFAAQFYSNNEVAANMYWYINSNVVASSQVNGTNDQSAYEGIEMAVTFKLDANDEVYIKSASTGYHLNTSYSYFCGHLVG